MILLSLARTGLAVRGQIAMLTAERPGQTLAVCPCMVLVPGPHFLNGIIDLVHGQLSLGAFRLLHTLLCRDLA